MKDVKRNAKNSALYTYLFFILTSIMYGFTYTPLDLVGTFHDVLLYLSIFFGILAFVSDGWNIKSLKKVILIMLISLAVYYSSKETIFVIMILAALIIKNTGYNEVMKIIFSVRLITFLIVILAVVCSAIPFNPHIVNKGMFGVEVAYGFGYNHPNNLAQEIFFLCTLYICIKNNKLKLNHIIFILLIDMLAYFITKSKAACLILAMICILLVIIKNKKNMVIINMYTRICLIISLILPTISVLFPIIMIYGSGKIQSIIYTINGYLNQRISNATMLFKTFKVTPFGKIIDLNILESIYGYNVVDNGFVFIFFNFGIIGFIVIISLYYLSLKKMIKKGEYIYMTIIIGFLVLAFIENVLRAMFMNFCMIFWWEVLNYIYKSKT